MTKFYNKSNEMPEEIFLPKRTKEGLPVVSEETLNEFFSRKDTALNGVLSEILEENPCVIGFLNELGSGSGAAAVELYQLLKLQAEKTKAGDYKE